MHRERLNCVCRVSSLTSFGQDVVLMSMSYCPVCEFNALTMEDFRFFNVLEAD